MTSRYIDLVNQKRVFFQISQPSTASNDLAALQNVLIENGMFPFLNGRTLLNWYKECTTKHEIFNFMVMASNFNLNFLENLEKGQSKLKLVQKNRTVGNGLRITVALNEVKAHIGLLYKELNEDGSVVHWTKGSRFHILAAVYLIL